VKEADTTSFEYSGDDSLRDAVEQALRGVVDPEMCLNIVDLGLVYRVAIDNERASLDITMTSAACPVAELIVADIEEALSAVLPPGSAIEVSLVWEPPWTPERMSPRARSAMGWD